MRQRLPNRRQSTTLDVWHHNERYHVSFSKDDSNCIKEFFVHGPKSGSDLDSIAYDIGAIASVCMQWGAPLGELRNTLSRLPSGEAASFVGSILDALEPLDSLDMFQEYARMYNNG
jgi:hypothetical protein